MAAPPKAPEAPPRRLFLVSIPRTASNLLVKVLGIREQPNVVTNHKAGYFFQDAYLVAVAKGYAMKPLSQWTAAEKTEILSTYQSCLDNLESSSAEARSQEKIFFTKEHAFWFANPSTIPPLPSSPSHRNQDEGPLDKFFRLRLPPYFGIDSDPATQTFSPKNKTLFPDAYLSTWQFAFIIRHPALAWPSMYRAMLKVARTHMLDEEGARAIAGSNMTWRWTRWLFDWSCEHQTALKPVILDAHDVIRNPEVVLKFCEITGLDKGVVRFEWGNADAQKNNGTKEIAEAWEGQKGNDIWNGESMDEAARIMTDTLRASKGLMEEKAPAEVDVEAEKEKWKEEFGVEVAEWLLGMVVAEMPDYEYLRARRLRV